MPCARCEAATVDLAVPESLQPYAPAPSITTCTNCLTIDAVDDGAADGDPDEISDELPAGEAGVATVLLVDLLDSLATNRADIEGLIDVLEAEGVDPMLVLDRLAEDPGLDPAVDVDRRSTQLQQLVL